MLDALERPTAHAAPDAPGTPPADFERRSVQTFRAYGWGPSFLLCFGRMAGFDGPEAHRFRQEALAHAKREPHPGLIAALARGLADCPSDAAHELRRELRTLGAPVPHLHVGLVGCDGPAHHAFRKELLDADPLVDDSGCPHGLLRCGGTEAVAMRRWLLTRCVQVEAAVAASLAGCDGPEADALRHELRGLAERLPPDARKTVVKGILSGLAGCVSPPSIELRWTLFAENADYAAVAQSCAGVWSPDLRELWECAAAHAPGAVADLLVGIDIPEAHGFRRTLFRRGCDPLALLRGLAGCDGPESWELRAEISDTLPDKGPIPLLPSVARCRSETAWDLRSRAATAGAARLALLEGIVGDGEPLP